MPGAPRDRKSTRLNSSHLGISYAVFCLKKNTEQRPSSRSRGGRNLRFRWPCAGQRKARRSRAPAGSASRLFTVPVDFFFNDTATTEIYTLSLHDALPI